VISKVVVLHDYGTVHGGACAVAHASAMGLARKGISVTMLTAVSPVAPNLSTVPGLEVLCLEQEEIVADPNRVRAFVRGIYNREAVAMVRRVLKDLDPASTIVHVHTWTKALSPFAIRAAIDLGFKVVISLHDFFITCPTGSFFVHSTDDLCLRQPLSLSCIGCHCDRRSHAQKLWRVARTAIQNKVLRIPEGVAHFVSVSKFSLDVMRPYLPKDAAITVLRNPVDCQEHGPVDVEANAPFVFIGRFSNEKGVLLFAEAAARLGLNAVFIGDGEVRAEAEKIYPGGTFTGWLTPQEVGQWLRRARALVFPPLWYETLGLVVVEAASHGVPAIIADRCAATDFVQDGISGLWFEHGSADALCEKLVAMQEKGRAAALGRRAYDWYWADPWNTERHVQELIDVYRQVLSPASS